MNSPSATPSAPRGPQDPRARRRTRWPPTQSRQPQSSSWSPPAILCTLIVPIYAHITPKIGDFPFFYFYLLAYMPLAAIALWVATLLQRRLATPAAGRGSGGGGGAMSNVNTVVFTIVLVLFVIVTVVGFLAARWRRAEAWCT